MKLLGDWLLLGYYLLCVIVPVILAGLDHRANKRVTETEEQRPNTRAAA